MESLPPVVWLGLLLAVASVLILIGAPLFRPRPTWMPFPEGDEVADLVAEKEKILRAMKDVEFEFENGTLSPEDRDTLRDGYKKEAVEVIKQMDALGKGRTKDLLEALEAEVARERGILEETE